LHHGEPPWPAWERPGELLRHGAITFAGMVWYGWPGVTAAALGWWWSSWGLLAVGLGLWLIAVIAIPGYMSFYCRDYDLAEVFDPLRALSRVRAGGRDYWRAWGIVIPTLVVSFVGLLGAGIGFLLTSVWFWQAAAFCFASVFTPRFELDGGRLRDE
jgi:hypothetical protein